MKRYTILWFLVWTLLPTTELMAQNQSVNYEDLIDRYQALSAKYTSCDLISFGLTDAGEPLHLLVINADGEFYPEAISKKATLLIQNGIHAGEPCGIDASIEWAESILENNEIPQNVVIGIIPVYNVGGMKNRGCCSRANQNGPEEHGFRGNARNLDLNRDYIKADSRNAMSFFRLFHWFKPQVFIDTHTSNGADYQYTMTLLSTRKERLDAHLSNFLVNKMEPYIYANYDSLTPYVNVFGTTPNDGIKAFNDLTRFSTGYAALFNCIGFTTEAHMWKPFDARKKATRDFIALLAGFVNSNYQEIVENKRISDSENPMDFESLNLKLDTNKFDKLNFYSYKPMYRYSEILGRDQLYYNTLQKETVEIQYFNYYNKAAEIHVPDYYYVSGAWQEVVVRLKANNIQMTAITSDTLIEGVGSYVSNFSMVSKPYEGHTPHKNVITQDSIISMKFGNGDYMVSTQQPSWRYILNVLEPRSEDSFFSWNFYDEITQQKEWYSAYVFEPYASEMLEQNEILKAEYDNKLASDPKFESGDYRLYWLYTKSPFYEPNHNRLPLLRIYK